MKPNQKKEPKKRKINNKSSKIKPRVLFIKSANLYQRAAIQALFSVGTLPSTCVSPKPHHVRRDLKRLTVGEKQTEALQAYFSIRQQGAIA